MIGQELIIRFKQDKAFLTSDKALSFEQLGLPEVAKYFKIEAFWIIKVLNTNPSEKKLFVQILSYQTGVVEFSNYQKQLADQLNEIEIVTFRNIDTLGLLKTLGATTPVRVIPTREQPIVRPEPIYDQLNKIADARVNHIIEEALIVPLKNVRFKLGCVSFDQKFKSFGRTLEVTIENDYIREEFDAVKNYFANVLNTKKIQVKVTLEVVNGQITVIDAQSSEIASIDDRLIVDVKLDFLRQISRKKNLTDLDKNLFTVDEYFEAFAENGVKSNAFYGSEEELFEDLLKISNTKHYRHLRFLSSKHAHGLMKLLIVHKPFSFIFLIEAKENYHIIWETLDTEEATYIWHIDKDSAALSICLTKVEDIIKTIKIHGKMAYISETEDLFTRIYHDYSEIEGGFVKWKGELEKFLN